MIRPIQSLRSWRPGGPPALSTLLGVVLALGCAARGAGDGLTNAATGAPAACPRDARRDAAGRCACTEGSVLASGACVGPAVGDAYCGVGQRMGADGCTVRSCPAGEAVDLATGSCVPWVAVQGGGVAAPCADPTRPLRTVPVAIGGRLACLSPADTCPRGTRRAGKVCARAPRCPPGALPEGEACRAFVSPGAGPTGGPRIDVGAWATLALGVDGGAGSEELCRPLARRADAFDLGPGETRRLAIRVAVRIPDEDLSRVVATVDVVAADGKPVAGEAGAPPLQPAAARAVIGAPGVEVVEQAVSTLIEPFRGLGGESSVAALDLVVVCSVSIP
jgi:hypothetical protein